MKPYSRRARRCPKCWCPDIRSQHHTLGKRGFQTRYSCHAAAELNTNQPPEHLCRTCCECGWREFVAPADAEPAPAPPPNPRHPWYPPKPRRRRWLRRG